MAKRITVTTVAALTTQLFGTPSRGTAINTGTKALPGFQWVAGAAFAVAARVLKGREAGAASSCRESDTASGLVAPDSRWAFPSTMKISFWRNQLPFVFFVLP
jgi:hypothetical protein